MADLIRHARSVSPWFIPNKGGIPRDLHGITSVSGGASVASEDIFVVGKSDKCATDKAIPESTLTITQLERGEIGSYLTLANLDSEPVGGLELLDFSSSLVDVALYERANFDGAIEQTFWFPKMAISSIALDIGDPEARIERSFDLVGDNEHQLNYDNKILIHKNDVAGSGVAGAYPIDLTSAGIPELDPNNSGVYILRVDRTRAGITETITAYTYNPTGEVLTITSALTGDEYNIYYSASAFGVDGDPTTVDSASPCFLKADSVTVLLSDGTTEIELDLLTSLSISATLNRLEEAVIGNDEKIVKEVESTTVDVSLSGRVKESTFAEAFMGQLGNDWGITDVKKFLDNVRVTVKLYSDATKSTFLIGYQVDNLSFTDDTQDFTANEFGTLDVSASSTNMLITTTEGDLT